MYKKDMKMVIEIEFNFCYFVCLVFLDIYLYISLFVLVYIIFYDF